jgi:hypothetical protein
MQAKTYLNRAATADALKDAQDAIRVEIHVREARLLGLAVVEVTTQHPDRIDGEQIMEDARWATLCVSGDDSRMTSWVSKLANLGVAYESYEFNLPRVAVDGEDGRPEDMWGEFLTDRVDSPAVRIGASVDESFEHGLPDAPPRPTVTIDPSNMLDVEVTLLNLKADPVAYRRVKEALEVAGFGDDTIDGAIAAVQAITAGLHGRPAVAAG